MKNYRKFAAALMLFGFVFSTVSPALATVVTANGKNGTADSTGIIIYDSSLETNVNKPKAGGPYSIALGYGTTAGGNTATAMGGFTTASNEYSTAMGYKTTAGGNSSTSMGYGTNASGLASTSMGYGTNASGKASAAMGYNTNAVGHGSFAGGGYYVNSDDNAAGGTAYGNSSFAFGIGAVAGVSGDAVNYSGTIALGNGAQAIHKNSVALGNGSVTTADNTISVGYSGGERKIMNVAAGMYLTDAVNYGQIVAKADYDGGTLTLRNADNVKITSVDIPYGDVPGYIMALKALDTDGGAQAASPGSLAAGYTASASADFSVALGYAACAAAQSSTVVGAMAGTGTSANSTSVGYQSGVSSENGVAVGAYACATQSDSVAIGYRSNTTISNTVSVGNAAENITRRIVNVADGVGDYDAVNKKQLDEAVSSGSLAYIGAKKSASGTDGNASADGAGSLAAGYRALVSTSGEYSTALGNSAMVSGAKNSTAVGAFACISAGTAVNSTSLGYNSTVTAQDAAALGAYACATAANSVAIGFNSCASESDTVSVGNASCSMTRRIVNVKAGTSANDAATFGQLTNYTAVKIKNGETTSDNITGSNGLVLEAGDNITLAADGANTIKISASGGGTLWEAGESGTGSIKAKSGDNHATKDYAVAMGLNTNASGEASTAMGFKSAAEGNYSLAAGFGTETHGGAAIAAGAGTNADGYAAIALGQDTTAKTNAVALGYATKAVAKASTATGYGSEAYGEGSFAGGGHVTGTQIVGGKAYGESSFAFGIGAVAGHIVSEETTNPDTGEHIAAVYGGDYTFAFGLNANAGNDNAIALGKDTNAAGNASVAMGENTNADGENSTAVGYGTTASGQYSTAMSFGTTADGIASVSTGYGSAAAGSGSFAGGGYYLTDSDNKTGGTAYGKSSFAFGEKANASGEASVAFGKNTNASGEASTALGFKSTAGGNYSLAAGFGAETHGGSSLSAGAGTNADGYAAIALGQDTTAKTNAVALGYATKAVAKASTATGYGSEAYGEGSFAGGGHVTGTQIVGGKAYGESSFAFGTGAVAGRIVSEETTNPDTGDPIAAVYGGDYTFAFGQNAVADKDNAIALGSGSSAGHANSVALGSSSVTAGEYEVSVGDAANNISRRLTNLAEGTSTNDAVNYGQFKKAVVEASYSGGVLTMTNEGGDTVFSQAFTSSGTIPGAVVYDNPDTKTKVTLNAGGEAVTVTNVADGTADSDAATYGQLKQNITRIETLETTVGNASSGLVKAVADIKADAVKTVSYDAATGKLTQTTINGTTTEIGTITGGGEDSNAVHYSADKSKIELLGSGGTTISNVKAGTADTDAVNVGQMNEKLAEKANAADLTAHTGNSGIHVTAAEKTKWNDYETTKADKATTLSGYGITDAYTKEEVNKKIASGGIEIVEGEKFDEDNDQKASATGAGAFAAGYNNNASGVKSTAVGYGNIVTGNSSGAFGDPNVVTGSGSYAIGNDNTIEGDNNFVLGSNVKLGKGVTNTVAFGSADGKPLEVTRSSTVAVGGRTISGLADGTAPMDAVNRRQLDVVRNELGSVSNEVKEVGAISAALAGLHYAEPSGEAGDKLVGAVAYGGYRGAGAEAVGLAYKPNPNMMLSASTSISNGNDSQNAYNVGFSLKFGKGETAVTRAELQKQVKYVSEENKALKDKVEKQDARIQALEELVNRLLKK
ncbi:MAG: YadA-like family protein [Synergistaceae bacterium]|nr:YadA-like family protein [Candidatus Equadaptatus faecalis]